MAKRRKRTNKDVPAKGRLRDIADQLWSLAVRNDWAHKCAVCKSGKCEAHHIVPRQHEQTRYDLQNGIALCAKHHQFDKDISPHQNAAGWLDWLEANYQARYEWYIANPRPFFNGVKNVEHYCNVIQQLREYVEPEDFERIVGVKFSRWLQEGRDE